MTERERLIDEAYKKILEAKQIHRYLNSYLLTIDLDNSTLVEIENHIQSGNFAAIKTLCEKHDLHRRTIYDLRQIARRLRVKDYWNYRKATLITLIEEQNRELARRISPTSSESES